MHLLFIILLSIPKDTTIHVYARSLVDGKTDTLRSNKNKDTLLFHHYPKVPVKKEETKK